MILDALQQFSSAQSLAQAAGSYDSTNVLDYGIINGIPGSGAGGGARDMGVGDPALKIFASIAAAFVGAGTVAVQISTAPDNGVGAPGNWTVAETGPDIPVASFNPGARIFQGDMPRPAAGAPLPRYIKLTYVVKGATLTAGAINAYVVLDRADRPEGPSGALSGYQAGINVVN